MSFQKYNLLGYTFGKWRVVERVYDYRHTKYHKGRTLKWRCICECGNESLITSTRLIKGVTTQCKKCSDKERLGNTYGQLPEGVASFNSLYNNYRRNAKIRGLEFSLAKDVFRKLTKQSCFYCNTKPAQIHNPAGMYNGYYVYNGIDRMNNNKGYLQDNCVACCKVCNYMKSNMDFDEFMDRLKTICSNVENKV